MVKVEFRNPFMLLAFRVSYDEKQKAVTNACIVRDELSEKIQI